MNARRLVSLALAAALGPSPVFAQADRPVAAARIANVAGALVVQKPGTATVSREEILAELLRA